ncbi:MAG: DNA polymerase [bacterium]
MKDWLALDCECVAWEGSRFVTVPEFVAGGLVTSVAPDEVMLFRDKEAMRAVVLRAAREGVEIVGHNLAFDLLVLGLVPELDWHVYDTMIADLLHRLSRDDCEDDHGPPRQRGLATLFGRELAGKGDTQLRFGEYRYAPLPAEYESYLREDVLATRWVYLDQQRWGGVPGGTSEMLRQVRASLALTRISMTGLPVDQIELARQQEVFGQELKRLQKELLGHGLYRPESRGPRGGLKKEGFEAKKFRRYMTDLAAARGLVLEQTDKGLVAIGEDALAPYRDDPVVSTWLAALDTQKIIGTFLNAWQDVERVHCRYNLLMRTGRTSCSDPNLQQVPSRGVRGGVKAVFVAPPGRVFYELDYAQLELCCLAQLTQGRMLELINAGKDLHRELGAVYFRKPAADVTKEERQLMKAANFGLPGGMGAKKFRSFIKSNGLPDPGETRTRDLINAWLEAYPEMEQWLAEGRGVNDRRVCRVWSGRDGESEAFTRACWEVALSRIGARSVPSHIYSSIVKGHGSPEVEAWVMGRDVVVTGGRRRYPVSYTEQRNTRFQGLAADLAKDALARIVLEGSEVATVHAFVHDSVLISVPDDDSREQRAGCIADSMLLAERRWLPSCRAGVEISGPGRSWLDAKNGPKQMKNQEVNRN